MVVQACNPSTKRWRQEDWGFRVILGYTVDRIKTKLDGTLQTKATANDHKNIFMLKRIVKC